MIYPGGRGEGEGEGVIKAIPWQGCKAETGEVTSGRRARFILAASKKNTKT